MIRTQGNHLTPTLVLADKLKKYFSLLSNHYNIAEFQNLDDYIRVVSSDKLKEEIDSIFTMIDKTAGKSILPKLIISVSHITKNINHGQLQYSKLESLKIVNKADPTDYEYLRGNSVEYERAIQFILINKDGYANSQLQFEVKNALASEFAHFDYPIQLFESDDPNKIYELENHFSATLNGVIEAEYQPLSLENNSLNTYITVLECVMRNMEFNVKYDAKVADVEEKGKAVPQKVFDKDKK